jgi:hypothetical protein
MHGPNVIEADAIKAVLALLLSARHSSNLQRAAPGQGTGGRFPVFSSAANHMG